MPTTRLPKLCLAKFQPKSAAHLGGAFCFPDGFFRNLCYNVIEVLYNWKLKGE